VSDKMGEQIGFGKCESCGVSRILFECIKNGKKKKLCVFASTHRFRSLRIVT